MERSSGFHDALKSFWSNAGLLLIIFVVYGVLIGVSYALRQPKPAQPKPPPMDVVFVFDTTGSMQPVINSVAQVCLNFADQLEAQGGECRIGVLTYGAQGEPVVIRKVHPLDSQIQEVKTFIASQQAEGGGPEDQTLALEETMRQMHFRAKAKRAVILITDEPVGGEELQGKPGPKTQSSLAWNELINEYSKQGLVVYAVAIPEEDFMHLAKQTGGRFYDIHSSKSLTGILMQVAQDIKANVVR